jgi:hypothetical protein
MYHNVHEHLDHCYSMQSKVCKWCMEMCVIDIRVGTTATLHTTPYWKCTTQQYVQFAQARASHKFGVVSVTLLLHRALLATALTRCV